MEEKTSLPIGTIINTIIGLLIMVSGYFLPQLSLVVEPAEKLASLNLPAVDGGLLLSVTPIGMVIITTFLGTIYLWTFVDTLWPCFLGIAALIFSGFAAPSKVLSMFLGNPLVVMIFFLLILAAAIVYSDLAGWFARYIMSRSFFIGRPWVLTTTVLFASYFIAFLDQTATMFLMWPAMFGIFKETGFKKGDKYVSIMTVYIGIAILCSFASDPFKGGAMYLLANLQSLASTEAAVTVPVLNLALYILFAMVVSTVSILLLVAIMRYIFRVDLTRLAQYRPTEAQRQVEPMNLLQKLVLLDFALYALWLLLPAVLPSDNVVGMFLKKNHLTGSLMAVLLLTVVFVKGKRVCNIQQSNSRYPWQVFFLIAVAMLLGGVMTGPGTNVSLYLEYSLRNLLNGLNPIAFTIAVAAIGIIFTNFCNSVVLGLMLTPVLLAVAAAFGINAAPMMSCFIFAVLIAACTPAASPFAATLFGLQDWISSKDAAIYAVMSSAVVFAVICCIGLPLATALF
ncbi:MAG: hypothetical protein HDQ92_01925 [Desulfovibrio sp.]|nr:hypothetical protein [Desulfovibrio sp.]